MHCSRQLLLLFFLLPNTLFAQVPRPDWIDRVEAEPGVESLLLSRSTGDEPSEGLSWLELNHASTWLPEAAVRGFGNDGAAWQGRGLNSRLTGGFQARWGAFSVTVEPQLSYALNLPIGLAPSVRSGGMGDYQNNLDRLQRFGTDQRWHWDGGNTEVRASWGPWTAGFGTEALWLGGGDHNAVLLSDNAGGFPHLDVGTRFPWKTEWGAFQGSMLWGLVTNSEGADPRFLHALVLGYSPPFFEHLTVGAARFFLSPWGTINLWKAFQSVDDALFKIARGSALDGTQGEDDVDQTAALYFDLKFVDQGFHAWLELARNDHAWDWRDLIAQPDHSLGYTFGLRQIVQLEGPWALYGAYEQADLGLNYGTVIRPTGSWYRRNTGDSGYTLGGQILGAAIGPGSNSNDLEVGVVHDNLSFGLAFKRVAFDVDYLVKVVKPTGPTALLNYNVLTLFGLKVGWHYEGYKLTAEVGEAVEYGRYWKVVAPSKGWFASVQLVYQP